MHHHLEKLDSKTQPEVEDARNEANVNETSYNQANQVPLEMADTSVEQTNVDPTDGSPAHRVIIIDAMAVVNSVVKNRANENMPRLCRCLPTDCL